MTEMHERQNGEICGRIGRTNKHDPSHDVHIRYQSDMMLSTIANGMYGYTDNNTSTQIVRFHSQCHNDDQYPVQRQRNIVENQIRHISSSSADNKGCFPLRVLREIDIRRHVVR
jgi:hypothetical protein